MNDFDDLELAVNGLDMMLTEARQRGVSVTEVDGDAFMEAASIIASAPRSERRRSIRWLRKRHPYFDIEFGGGNA